MDVVNAGAADHGAATRGCVGARQGKTDRGRSRGRPYLACACRRADRGNVVMSQNAAMNQGLRILITGFGPFPGAPFNPTTPLVKRLTQLRRPALDDIMLTGHIFHVTYQAVDRELPALLA